MSLKSIARKVRIIFIHFGKYLISVTQFLVEGFRSGCGLRRCKQFLFMTAKQIYDVKKVLCDEIFQCAYPYQMEIKSLQSRVKGLHSLLSKDILYSYSILIWLKKPSLKYLKESIESALSQTAPNCEVLIGSDEEIGEEIDQYLRTLEKEQKVRYFKKCSLNELINNSTGHFLFFLNQDGWIRPDTLYRYELTLRALHEPENTVLYCNEYEINEKSYPIVNNQLRPAPILHFPYIFKAFNPQSLLIPRKLWNSIKHYNFIDESTQTFDYLLRLDIAGAHFVHVPSFLTACRSSNKCLTIKERSTAFPTNQLVKIAKDYVKDKKLDWDIEAGYLGDVFRAIPRLKEIPTVQVIIPFKDQKDLTLKCVESLKTQEGVKLKITAVDNNSSDRSISDELSRKGVEVLFSAEPFNYSRLNNFAVRESKLTDQNDILLFLNNDVELNKGTILEMARWIGQPKIGMVGCRLNYPSGALQHGGITLDGKSPDGIMPWREVEKHLTFEDLNRAKQINICDAVTAACAMVKRDLFLSVGGFDEVWYPIAYSDTNLALKLKKKGCLSLYTPYAEAVHYESATRKPTYEDFEASIWLNDLYHKNELNKEIK